MRLSHKNARFLVRIGRALARSSQHILPLLYHLPFLPNPHPFLTRPLPPVVSEHASLALLHLSVLCSTAHPFALLPHTPFSALLHCASLALLPHTSLAFSSHALCLPWRSSLWRPNTHIPCPTPAHIPCPSAFSHTHIPCLLCPLMRSSSLCFQTHTFLPFYTLQCFVPSPTHIACLLLSRALPPWEPHAHPSPSTPLSGPFRGCVQMVTAPT